MPHGLGMMGHGRLPPMVLRELARLRNARFDPLAQNIASNSAKTDNIPASAWPMDVAKSNASCSEIKLTPKVCNSWSTSLSRHCLPVTSEFLWDGVPEVLAVKCLLHFLLQFGQRTRRHLNHGA